MLITREDLQRLCPRPSNAGAGAIWDAASERG
jgi:hypothetical protein